MKHPILHIATVLLVLSVASCSDTPQHREPSLIPQDDTASGAQVSEPLPLPKTGEGNFENLVADFESEDRVIWQKPGMVISLLGDLEGRTVADIGAGTGYFTFRIVPLAQKVIGIDIDPRFISFMDSVKVRLPQAYQSRFESRLAKLDDPLLQPEEVDAVMIVNTYGYIGNRPVYLRKLWTGMKPDADLLIIDFKKNNLPIGPSDEFKVSHTQVRQELEQSGFEVVNIDRNALDYQYIIQARKRADKK
jgi:SAM-dependent methyltransferase